jgi:hypothetical protein
MAQVCFSEAPPLTARQAIGIGFFSSALCRRLCRQHIFFFLFFAPCTPGIAFFIFRNIKK